MNLLEHNAREVEILKQIPKPERIEFIEEHGEELRSLLELHIEMTNREIIQCLTRDYVGIE